MHSEENPTLYKSELKNMGQVHGRSHVIKSQNHKFKKSQNQVQSSDYWPCGISVKQNVGKTSTNNLNQQYSAALCSGDKISKERIGKNSKNQL